MAKRYDKSPSKAFNCRLSLTCLEQMAALIERDAYETQRVVIETAVELLFNSVNGSHRVLPDRVVSEPTIKTTSERTWKGPIPKPSERGK